jgi:hypothetical protein
VIERTEFLYPGELALITADAAGLANDSEVGVPATFRKFVSRTFTPSTGASTPTYTDYAVNVIESYLTVSEVRASDGLFQTGDVRLAIPRSILSISPNEGDVIVLRGETYTLIHWNSDPLSIFWRIVSRKGT